MNLPPEMVTQVRRCFRMCLDKFMVAGHSPDGAAKLLATITGATAVTNALDDMRAYDRAPRELMRVS